MNFKPVFQILAVAICFFAFSAIGLDSSLVAQFGGAGGTTGGLGGTTGTTTTDGGFAGTTGGFGGTTGGGFGGGNNVGTGFGQGFGNDFFDGEAEQMVTSGTFVGAAVINLSLIHISEPTRPY